MTVQIVIDDKIPFIHGVFEKVGCDVKYLDGAMMDNAFIRQADALIIRTRTRCNASLLEGTNVRFIATTTIGFDHIDTDYCEKNGIQWINSPGCNAESVAQYVGCSVLSFLQNKPSLQHFATAGIIGVGHVGSAVEKVFRALGLHILRNDPPRAINEPEEKFIELDLLCQSSDIVTLHVPLIKVGKNMTTGLVNDDFLAHLRPHTALINSSRGAVVKEDSLHRSLDSQKLSWVALDVWQNEPNIDINLMNRIQIATPHIAGYSIDGKANGTNAAVQAVSQFFNLGLTNWHVTNLPQPSNAILDLRPYADLSNFDLLYKAMTFSYNVFRDDQALRHNVLQFEHLRGYYEFRREPCAYTIQIQEAHPIISSLKMLGFQIQN